VAEVGILVVEDDIASQRAIKNVLDAEGWRVRIVPVASHLMAELATGNWSLIIVNVSLIDLQSPLFSTLKDLAQADSAPVIETTDGNALPVAGSSGNNASQTRIKGLRALFLVPVYGGQKAQAILEREELPYTLKPYHLHDFLEKVSELLVEAGALAEPMRTMGTALGRKRRRNDARISRDTRRGAMFASREDYQMTEEEMADFERQEEEDRKKREKELQDRYHR
jgi:CheY-like chemotaxis protein